MAKIECLEKSHKSDGTVKISRCKARESLGMKRTYQYAAVTKDEAQRCPSASLRAMSLSNGRWTFYEAVKIDILATCQVCEAEEIIKEDQELSVKPMHGCLHCNQGILRYIGIHKTYRDVEEYVCQRCKRFHYLNRLTGQVSLRLETFMEKYPQKSNKGTSKEEI